MASIAVLWQLWLFRVGITVDGLVVRLRGVVRTREIPVEAVRSFGLAPNRRLLDHFEREACLVIHLHDGVEVMWRWVGWRDVISAFLVEAERPLRPSQKRALDRLNGALARS